MRRLTSYLVRLFATDTLILFGVVSFLLWLVQCLRIFDTVSLKGQGLLTLAQQGLLSMPPLVLTFAFVCIGIGLARAIVALQASRELHIIHTADGFSPLLRSALFVVGVSALVVMLISNFIAPLARQQLDTLNASITADLVSSTLRPGQFSQVTPGVLVLIGERSGNGVISEFFADDRRDPNERRTYIADSATVAESDDGYILELRDGAIQTRTPRGQFSEIRFGRYRLNVDRFNTDLDNGSSLSPVDTIALLQRVASTGMTERIAGELVERFGEGLRVLGLCLLVLALCAFPSGSRTRLNVPMEVFVLFIAFCDLAITSYRPFGPLIGPILGGAVMTLIGFVVLVWRTRLRRIPPVRGEVPT
ncbi:hypothetical protein GCM10007989_34120 [Devosia pacifica]|uniref:Lipopolysaccharide export system permease protein LptF n=1 Tax=Devosia pacifica TaxID=1335967 RepID=A0A918VYD5_9HYPH|nr:LptF/LptG family permease [Devosia pacifica]GHA35360.1 hypothetical protein GCM10007989_34120 [Devosia pacifica]